MDIDDVGDIAEALEGVRRRGPSSGAEWRYHGRLVVRQIDAEHVVIRCDFGPRDALLAQSPDTFSVPTRFVKHMMIVAALPSADRGVVEDAIEAAWALQRSAD